MDAEETICLVNIIIAVVIIILYLVNYRKKIAQVIKTRELPHHELQKRKCPGCGSEDIMIEKDGSMRCNKCGVLLGAGK